VSSVLRGISSGVLCCHALCSVGGIEENYEKYSVKVYCQNCYSVVQLISCFSIYSGAHSLSVNTSNKNLC
jgi:hypothetical protein